MEQIVQFSKLDAEKQLAYGVVYAPNVPDSQGDFMSAEEIEKMAHNFMKDGHITKVDTEHNMKENGAVVVETFIARKGDPDFAENAWIVGIHAPDEVWTMIKSGELNGFSMFGSGKRTEAVVEIEVPDSGILKGTTQLDKALDHNHEFWIKFDAKGNFLGGNTGPPLNGQDAHTHRITKGTITDEAAGHVHPFSFMDAIVSRETADEDRG